MVDFIRIFWKDKERFEILVCDPLNFREVHARIELHSAEIKYPYLVDFNGLDLRVTNKHSYLQNSLHKSYNIISGDSSHNYNDFSFHNLCDTIDLICNKLIDLDRARITQLEYGFNLHPSVSASRIIRENLLMHKYKGPNHNRHFDGRGQLKQFDYHNFFIKIYDKGFQYERPENILRFEVRYRNSKELNKIGITHLEDLKQKGNHRRLFKDVRKKFNELTIVDHFGYQSLPDRDRTKLSYYNNPAYWEHTLSRYSYQTKMRKTRDYERLIEEYELGSIKATLSELLLKKFAELMNS